MGKDILGEFEHHVLLAAVRLEGEAYSAAIVQELERRTGRDVSPAAVYIALRRLEDSGFATSELRTGEDGSRERRYAQNVLTAANLSYTFGLPLSLTRTDGRFTARRAA